jgi:hypothetical protein
MILGACKASVGADPNLGGQARQSAPRRSSPGAGFFCGTALRNHATLTDRRIRRLRANRHLMQWCYFLRDRDIAAVEMLPSGFSDEDEITRAHVLFSTRKGSFDGFEIWDGVRLVFRYPDPATTPEPPDPL